MVFIERGEDGFYRIRMRVGFYRRGAWMGFYRRERVGD